MSCDVEDVVAAIVQVVAGAPDRAERGIARGHARKGDRLLRPGGGLLLAHSVSPSGRQRVETAVLRPPFSDANIAKSDGRRKARSCVVE